MNGLELKEKRLLAGLTQKELAEMLHSSRKTINGYENGVNIPLPKIELLNAIFSKLEKKTLPNEVTPIPYDNYMEVEYADLSAAAGKLGVENPAILPNTKKRLLPKEFERGNYLVVKVDGDSMDNGTSISIPDGTEILIRECYLDLRKERLPIRGNLFVIVTTTGNVFKQIVEQNMKEGYIVCHSYNEMFEDYKVEFSEILQIFLYRKIVSFRPTIPEI